MCLAVDLQGTELQPSDLEANVFTLCAITLAHLVFFLNLWDWRDGSVVKNTGHSSSGPRFNSQDEFQVSNGILWGLQALHAHGAGKAHKF